MKLRLRRPSHAEQAANADPFTKFDFTAAELLARAAFSPNPTDMIPGVTTDVDEGHLFITRAYSPAAGEQLILWRDGTGTWQMVHQSWRPGTEQEVHGASVFRTSIRPISPTLGGTSITEVGLRRHDGDITPLGDPCTNNLPPVDYEYCGQITETLQGFLDSAR